MGKASIPHVINQSTINYQKDNLLYGTLDYTMTQHVISLNIGNHNVI